MLPEYSASSKASIVPPLLFKPFHLVQNTLDHLTGLSSASRAPALVRFRPHENDAGANVYTPFDCTLNPGDIIKIPLGFGIEIPDGFAWYVFPRSSLAVKGLVCELPPIDSGYRGEIHAIISNVSSVRQTIKKDTRIGQLVITPVVIADFVLDFGEERGTGAFGSTGE